MSTPVPRLKVAWIPDFPLEWLPDLPLSIANLPRMHPMTWQRVLLEEFEKRSDLELHILVLRKNIPHSFDFERNGVKFHVLKYPGGVRTASLFWWDTFLIKRKLSEIKPDLLHAWGTEKGAAVVAKRLGYPYLVTIQGLMSWYKELVPLNRYEKFAAWLEKHSLPQAPLVTTESKAAIHYLENRFPGIRLLQAEHAPNWIFHEIKREPQTAPIRFLFVGTLGYRKGADLLFHALEKLMNHLVFELVVVGSPDETISPLLAEMRSKPIWTRVNMLGNLQPSQIAQQLSKATMLVFPTRADTSPNAVKEAVVAGVPVVASAIGGILDYVVPEQNGILFQSGDMPGFVKALRAAAAHPLFSRGMVDGKCCKRMQEYLSPKEMGERFRQGYKIATSERPSLKHPFP
ncbi:MAG TPA: glycosyltransferase [Verrucomicrobiae bacterium]